jgi:hypothetical protein
LIWKFASEITFRVVDLAFGHSCTAGKDMKRKRKQKGVKNKAGFLGLGKSCLSGICWQPVSQPDSAGLPSDRDDGTFTA